MLLSSFSFFKAIRKSSLLKTLRGISVITLVAGALSHSVHASSTWGGVSLGLGFSWGNQTHNPYLGYPICPYGVGCNSALLANPCAVAAAAGQLCAAQGGSFSGHLPPSFGSGLAGLPPPPPFIPPHAYGGFVGGGFSPVPPSYQISPPFLGYQIPSNHFYHTGPTVIDLRNRNEWEKDDAGSIVLAAGIGMGMQATNVFPIIPPRNCLTCSLIPPMWFHQGERTLGFEPRPSH